MGVPKRKFAETGSLSVFLPDSQRKSRCLLVDRYEDFLKGQFLPIFALHFGGLKVCRFLFLQCVALVALSVFEIEFLLSHHT